MDPNTYIRSPKLNRGPSRPKKGQKTAILARFSTFLRQFKNGKLPDSFSDFFQNIPFNEQKSRDDDYNLRKPTNIALLHFPSAKIIRSWNQNHLTLKSEADITAFKEDFIQKKLKTYDEECSKANCSACQHSN